MATETGREVCDAKECNTNSWIPGRQCVLARLPSGIGHEQFHSSFYEALSKLQDCKDKPVKEKAALLVVIWKSLGACASSLNEVSNVFQFLFSETSLVILSREWADVNPVLKERLQTVIKECSQSLCQLVDEAARLCGVLTMALHDPWGESLLRELLTSPEGSLVSFDNNCFTKDGIQPEGLLLKRIEQLSAVGCEDAALQLCKICLQCHQNSCETRSFVNASYGPETSEQEIEGTFIDWLLRLLHRTGRLAELVRETMKYTCHDGVRLIRRVQQSNEPDSLDLAEVLTHAFLVGDFLQTSTYCCTKELMVLWCDIQVEKDRELEEVFKAVKMLLVCYAATSAHFYLFVDILWKKYGPSLFPLYIEMYVRGLTSDLNYLEAISIKGSTDEVKELQVHISSVYNKFGTLFASRWPVVAYECVLSSFSLDPTDDKISVLYNLHKSIYGEQEDTEINDILHLARSSGGNVTSVSQIECKCGGRCSTPSEEPEILASLYHDGRPPYIYNYSHPILDTHIPGVSFSLLKDLVVVLECLRCQLLKANKCWKEVESLCKSYIANNCKLNVAMQYSSSLGKETDLVSDHRVCLPAVMETCYLNRTKENYYCYTQNEVNTPLSCASSFPSDVSRTLFIQKSISSSMNKTLYSVTTVPSSISTVFPSAINPYNTNLSIPCEKNTPIMNLSFPLENDISTRINANSLNLNVMSPNNRTSLFADSLSPVANIISPCTNNVSSDMNISLNRASSVSFSINTVPLHAKNIFQAIDTTLPSGSNESSVDMKSSCTVTPCTETFVPSTHTMSSTISTPIHEKTSLSCHNNLSPSVNTILPFSCESTVSSISGTAVCCTSSTFTVNNVENELVSTTVAETTEDSVCGFGKEQESENVKRRKTLSECEKESHYLSEVPSVTGDSFKTGLMPSEVILPRVEVTTAESVKPTDTQTVKVVLSRLDLGSVKSIYIPKVVDNFEKTSTSKVKSVVKKPVVVLSDILSPKFLSDPNTTHFVQQALMKHHGIEAKRKSSDVDTGQSTKKLKVTVVKLMTPEDRESEKFVSKSFRKDFQSTRDNSLGPFVSTCSVYGDKMSVHSKKEASCSPVSPMNLEFSSLESKPCVAQGKSHETGQSEVSIGVSSPGENSSIIQCKKINDLSLSNLRTVSPSMKNSVNLLYGTVNSSLQREKELVQSHMHDVDKKASDHRGRIKKTNSNLPQIVETHSTSNDTCTINSIAQEESSDESQRLNIREANESAQNISVEDAASGVQLQRSHNCSISFISSFEKFIQIEEERRKTLDCEKPLEPSVSLSKDLLDTDNTKRKSLVCKESFQISSSMDQEISQINCEKNENINSAKSSENCLSSVELKKSNMIVKESDKAKQCSHPSGNEMKCSILDESASLQFATSCSTDDKSENSSSLLSSFYDKQVKNTSPSYSYGNFNSSNSVNIIPEEFTSKLTDNFESSPDGKGIEKMDIRGTKATSWTSMSSDSEMRNFMDETIGLQRDEAINVDKNNIFNVMICSSSTETMSSASLPELHDCGNSIPDSSASKVRLLVKKCTSQQKSSLKEDKQLIGDSGSECVAHLSPLYSLTLNDKLYSRALYSNVMLGHERDKAIKNSKIEVKSTLVSEGNMCTTSLNTPALEEEDCKMEMLLSNKTTAPVLSVVTSEERSSIMMRKIHRIPVFLTNRPFVGTAKKEVLEVSKGSDCNSYLTKPIIETATCSAFPSVGESKMFETRSIKPEHQKDRTEASDGEIRFGAKLVNRGGKEIAGKLIIPVSNISNPALKTLLFSTTIKSGVLKNYSSLGDSKTNTAVSVMNSKPLMSVCTEKKGREENTTQNMKTSMHVMKVQNTPVINSLPFQSMNSDSPINIILKDGDFNQLGKITPGKSISIPSVEGVQGKLDIFCNATMKTVNSVSVDGSLDTVNFSCKVSRGTVNPSPFIQAIPEAVNFEIFVEDESETASAFSDSELIAGRISSTFTGKMASKTIDLVPLETVSSRQSVKDSLKTRSTSSSKVTSEMLNYIPSVKVTSETVNSTPSNPVTPKTVNFTPSVKMQRTESSTSNVQVTPGTLNFTPIRVTTRTVNFTPSTLMTNIKVNSTCSVKATTKTVNSISSVQVTPGILNSTSSIPVTPGTVISTPLVQVKKIIGSPVSADHITPGTKNFTPIVCVAPGSVNSTSFTQMTPRTLNSTSSFRIQDTSEIVNSASVDVTSETLNSTPSIQVIPGTINSTSPIHVTSESVDYIPLVQMKRTLGSLIPTVQVIPKTHYIHRTPRTVNAISSVYEAPGTINIPHSTRVTLKQAKPIIPPETTLKYSISSFQEQSQPSSIPSLEVLQKTLSVTPAVENSVEGMNCTLSSEMTQKPVRSNISNEGKLDNRKFIHPVEKVPKQICSAHYGVESTRIVKSPCVLKLAVETSKLSLSHEATTTTKTSNFSNKKQLETVNGETSPKTLNVTPVDEVSLGGAVISAPCVKEMLRTRKALSFAGVIPKTFNSTILEEVRPLIHLKPLKEISSVPSKQPVNVIRTANVTLPILTATSNRVVTSDIKTTASASKSTPKVGLKTVVIKRKSSGEMTVMTLNENSSAEVPEANSKLKYNKSSVSFLSVTAAKSSRAPVMHSHSICTKNMEKKRGWIPVRNAPGVMEYRKAPHHRQFSVGSAQRSDAVGKVNTYPQLKFPYVHSSMMQTSGISQVTSAKSVSGQTLLNCMQTQSGSSLLLKNNQNLFNQKTGTAKKSENISKSTKGTIILLREDVVRDSANAFQTVLQEQKSSSAWKTCPQKLTCVQKNSIKSNECSHSQLPCLHSVSHYTLDRSIDAELKESNLELNTAEVTKMKTIPTDSLLSTETFSSSSRQQASDSMSHHEREFQPLVEQSKDASPSSTKPQRKVNTVGNSEFQVKSHGMKRVMDTRKAVKCMRYTHVSKSTGDNLIKDIHDS